jgi:5-methylcytosine-specific restriction enzyme subunit McrC
MAIPVQNVYYLLCYAWNRIEARDKVDVSSLTGDRIENLFAKVLTEGTAHLIRSGMDRGYVTETQEERRVRGKLLVSQSVKRCLLKRGIASCSVDELSYDLPHNRILKAAIRELLRLETVDASFRLRLKSHVQSLGLVGDVPLTPGAFRGIQLHRGNARYGLLLDFCRLLANCLLPTPGRGPRRFHPFTASEQQMGELFQSFVRNFLSREQATYRVSAPKLSWGETALPGTPNGWLPEMRTDAVLQSDDHAVVIEIKYYADPASSHFGAQRLRSAHLYQLGTYLDHFATEKAACGLLLYAAPPSLPDQDYLIRGRRIHVRSLRLDQPWQEIHRALLRLIESLSP